MSLGDLIVDVVVTASGPLAHGSDRAGSIGFRQGGSAANTARWVARCGGQAVFIGAVGRDEWGRRLGAALAEAGVEAHLITRNAPTARIVVLVEADGERSFVTDRGAADLLAPDDTSARAGSGDVMVSLGSSRSRSTCRATRSTPSLSPRHRVAPSSWPARRER